MEKLGFNPLGQWTLTKSDMSKGDKISGKPIFNMEHIGNAASAADHTKAREIANEAIKSSNAHKRNKAKASLAVMQSKSKNHLVSAMTNFHMAHDARIQRRLSGRKDSE